MANVQITVPNTTFICKNKSATGSTNPLGTPANYASVSALRTRLAAINGTYYTSARLDSMTVNDMVYAVRLNDDAGTM